LRTRTAMHLMNTLRTSREKETRLPIMPLDCSPGMWCSTARRLTRGVLGWDTLGGPDAGIFDTLGGPDRRAGEDHQPALVASGHRDIMAPTINSYILAQHIPDAQLITTPTPARLPVPVPSLFVAHVARFPRHRRRLHP